MTALLSPLQDALVVARGFIKANGLGPWFEWLAPAAAALLAVLLARAALRRLWPVLLFWALKTPTTLDDLLLSHLRGPARWATALMAFQWAGELAAWPAVAQRAIQPVLNALWIGVLAWAALETTRAVGHALDRFYSRQEADDLHARVARTQARVFQRLATAVIFLAAIIAGLMSFEGLRGYGASLLASAGLAGVVIGFAAQRTLGALVAGVQFALAQPFRMDDVVIVEGEWGRIEEITFTYVVVRVWDERRLIVPLTYFLEKPFQNWTYQSAQILGAVFVECDYSAPLDHLRAELERICREEGAALWDGRVAILQVTGAERGVLTLRALVSSADASKNWDLRCMVREGLIVWLQRERPAALPKVRLADPSEARRDGGFRESPEIDAPPSVAEAGAAVARLRSAPG